jgi:DNA polymerase-3 subunit beta
MKFSVTSNELIGAINKVIGVVPTRSTLPILGNVYLSLEGNALTIIGTDLEIYIKVTILVSGKVDGKVAVPAKRLETLLENLGDRELSIELQQNFKLVIKAKGARWVITGEDPNDFPLPSNIENPRTVEINNIMLCKYLSKAIHAASADELRRSMNGIFFEIKKDEFKVVSTDGHRLVKITKSNFNYDGEKFTLLVPIKTSQIINRLFKGSKMMDAKTTALSSEDSNDENVEKEQPPISSNVIISLSNEFMQCDFDNISVTSRLIDDTFPNYESVIPTDNEKTLKVEKLSLIGSVKRSIIMSDEVTKRTSFNVNDNELKVKAANNEYGTDSEEIIECNFTDNEPFEISFNGKYLLEAIQHFDSNEILFDFNSPLKASILRPSEQNKDEEMMMLVMPVRNI